jgi:transcriptional regulator with XRE-family HTH domain
MSMKQPAAGGGSGRVGIRGVALGKMMDQPCLNIVASPTASYLLPDLAPTLYSVSVGAAETRRLAGVVIVGDSMIVRGSVRDDDFLEQRRWLALQRALEQLLPIPRPTAPVEEALVVDERAPLLVVDEAHRTAVDHLLPIDASIQATASRIYELSGLSDAKLADLFKVARETFNRWRLGAMTNPTAATRRRVGMVLRLLEDLDRRGVLISNWLQNPSAGDGVTPYDLLVKGRIDEAAYLALVAGSYAAPPARGKMEEPLVFEDDDGWQSLDIEVTDDAD